MATRAGDRLRARLGPAALALVAGDQGRNAYRRLPAAEALLERHLEIVPQVAAAVRSCLAAPAAHQVAEHLVKNVGEASGEAEIARTPSAALLERSMAEAVIGGALLIVLEDVVSLVEILEFLLGALVTRIAIRVILHRELAISLF